MELFNLYYKYMLIYIISLSLSLYWSLVICYICYIQYVIL